MHYIAIIHEDGRGHDLADATTGEALPEEVVTVTIYDHLNTCIDEAVYHTINAYGWEPDLVTAALAYSGFAPTMPLTEGNPLTQIPLAKTTPSSYSPCLPNAVTWG